jgi:polyribonucleotide nucleotidyltransferase
MDAGVPIKKAVAGIAIGLVTNPKDRSDYRILTDIQGFEDHAGDMDFKVAGTVDGITAIQLDIKLDGVSLDVLNEGLAKARAARLQIIEKMNGVIAAPRTELSPYAPRIEILKIDPEQIREVIGPGGKVINDIIEKTGVEIDIEQDGTVMITANDRAAGDKAMEIVKGITRKIQVGEEFEGEVTQIMTDRNRGNEIGAIVQLTPNHDGMVHISNLANEHVAKVSDVVKVGDKIKVRVVEVDEEKGRIGLSHKEWAKPAADGSSGEPTYRRGGFRARGGFRDHKRNDRRPFPKKY